MSTITAWILVGIVTAGGRFGPPPEHLFPDRATCENVKRNIEEVASGSNLRCVETKVIVEKN
jgi:hypothetical protein